MITHVHQTAAESAAPTTTRIEKLRRPALILTILACLPYLTLKLIWIAGGDLGIPAGSELLDPDNATSMRTLNGLTVLMDSAVILLALVFARGAGRGVPAWLIAGPAWVATGLLGPIVAGYPFSVVVELVDSSAGAGEGWLESWVFVLVYGGFMLQAVGLGTLFASYAAQRWGAVWQGRTMAGLDDRGILPALRVAAVAAVVVGLTPVAVRAGRVIGIVDDLSLRERFTEGMYASFAVLGMVGILMLAFARHRSTSLLPVLVTTWVGSAVMTTTSLWMLLTLSVDTALPDGITPFDQMLLALTMGAGVLIVSAGMSQLAILADSSRPRTDRPRPAPAAAPARRVG